MRLPTHICLRWNCQLYLTWTDSSYPKWKDRLHTLNVYKIPAKENQGVDRSATYEISVLEILFWKQLEYVPLILPNHKKLKWTKIVRSTIFSFLSAQYVLVTAAQ